MEAEQRDGFTLTKVEDIESNGGKQDVGSTSFFKTCFNGLNALSGLSFSDATLLSLKYDLFVTKELNTKFFDYAL